MERTGRRELGIQMKRIYAIAISLALLVATPGLATADTNTTTQLPHQQAIDLVISRALSQRGVPYLYGGGNVAGPTPGTGLYANTVGFDASGLIQYAFAGVGIKMPRSSGEQYNVGRQITP